MQTLSSEHVSLTLYYSTMCHPTLTDLYDVNTMHTEGLSAVKFSAKCSKFQGFTSMYCKQLNLLHSALGQRLTVPCQTQKSFLGKFIQVVFFGM